jgi:hypothetical protein
MISYTIHTTIQTKIMYHHVQVTKQSTCSISSCLVLFATHLSRTIDPIHLCSPNQTLPKKPPKLGKKKKEPLEMQVFALFLGKRLQVVLTKDGRLYGLWAMANWRWVVLIGLHVSSHPGAYHQCGTGVYPGLKFSPYHIGCSDAN